MEDPRGTFRRSSKPLPVYHGKIVAIYDMVLISDVEDGRSVPQVTNRVDFRLNCVYIIPDRYHKHMKSRFK